MPAARCEFCAEELPVDAEGLERCPSCGERLDEPELELPWRPTSLLVLGILNICFGALAGIGAVGALFMIFMTQTQGGTSGTWAMAGASPTVFILQQALNLLGGLVGLALGVAGVGLLLMKPWGRRVSLSCAVYMILQTVLGVALAAFQFAPLTGAGAPIWVMVGSLVVGTCFALIYPIVLLVLLNRPIVIDAFRRAAAAAEAAPA